MDYKVISNTNIKQNVESFSSMESVEIEPSEDGGELYQEEEVGSDKMVYDSSSQVSEVDSKENTKLYEKDWRITITARNLYKLFTKEDYKNVHKMLGITSLLHYAYRFLNLIIYGTMGFEKNTQIQVLGCIFLHFMLSWSSFIFQLPLKRNKIKPMIWPELRLHNCIFATRSILDMIIHTFGIATFGYGVFRFLIAFIAMIAADKVSSYYKKKDLLDGNDSTMRGAPWPKDAPKKLVSTFNYSYGVIQLLGTYGILNVTRKWHVDIELSFATLFAIQISAFLLTLVRKSILQTFGFHFWYSVALGINCGLGLIRTLETSSYLNVLLRTVIGFSLAYFIRFHLNINKYFFWSVVFVFDYCFVLKFPYTDFPF